MSQHLFPVKGSTRGCRPPSGGGQRETRLHSQSVNLQQVVIGREAAKLKPGVPTVPHNHTVSGVGYRSLAGVALTKFMLATEMGVGKSKAVCVGDHHCNHHEALVFPTPVVPLYAAPIVALYPQAVCFGDHNEALVYAASGASVSPTVTIAVQGIGRHAQLPPLTCVRILGRASLLFWLPAGLAPGDFEFRVTSTTNQAIGFLRRGDSRIVLNRVVRLYRGQYRSHPLVEFPSGRPVSAFDTIEVLLPGCEPIKCFREADGATSWDAALPPGRYSYQLRVAPRRSHNSPGPFLTDAPIPLTGARIGRRGVTFGNVAACSPAASTLDVFGVPGDPGSSSGDCCPSCLTEPVGVLVHHGHYVCQGCLEGWARSCLQVNQAGRGRCGRGAQGQASPSRCTLPPPANRHRAGGRPDAHSCPVPSVPPRWRCRSSPGASPPLTWPLSSATPLWRAG